MGIAFLIGLVPVYLVATNTSIWWYVSGTSTTAKPTRCWNDYVGKGHYETHCEGIWALPDGAEHSGEIFGAVRGDVGRPLKVRADSRHAVSLRFNQVLWFLVSVGGSTAGICAVYRYRQRIAQELRSRLPRRVHR